MRDVTNTDTITIEINDPVAGGIHVFYARPPTTRERFQYQGRQFERKGKKIINRLPSLRQEFGRKVLLGFEDRGLLGEGGQALSSDPQAENYREDWLDLIASGFPEAIDVVAQIVFESVRQVPDREGMKDLTFELEGEAEADKERGQKESGREDGEVETLDSPLPS